jgi:hypothetical protein
MCMCLCACVYLREREKEGRRWRAYIEGNRDGETKYERVSEREKNTHTEKYLEKEKIVQK